MKRVTFKAFEPVIHLVVIVHVLSDLVELSLNPSIAFLTSVPHGTGIQFGIRAKSSILLAITSFVIAQQPSGIQLRASHESRQNIVTRKPLSVGIDEALSLLLQHFR
jgi:hypothetical protein